MSPSKLALLALTLASAGLVGVILSYFVLVPYQTIPDKNAFWIGFLGWTLPFTIAILAVRNKPPRRISQLLGDVMIAVCFGIAIALGLGSRWSPLQSAADAAMPGVLCGILVGMNILFISRILKGQVGPGY